MSPHVSNCLPTGVLQKCFLKKSLEKIPLWLCLEQKTWYFLFKINFLFKIYLKITSITNRSTDGTTACLGAPGLAVPTSLGSSSVHHSWSCVVGVTHPQNNPKYTMQWGSPSAAAASSIGNNDGVMGWLVGTALLSSVPPHNAWKNTVSIIFLSSRNGRGRIKSEFILPALITKKIWLDAVRAIWIRQSFL